jgi:hypothetical protein
LRRLREPPRIRCSLNKRASLRGASSRPAPGEQQASLFRSSTGACSSSKASVSVSVSGMPASPREHAPATPRGSAYASASSRPPRVLQAGDSDSAAGGRSAVIAAAHMHGTRQRERDCCFPRMQERGGADCAPADDWSSSHAGVSSPGSRCLACLRERERLSRSRSGFVWQPLGARRRTWTRCERCGRPGDGSLRATFQPAVDPEAMQTGHQLRVVAQEYGKQGRRT